MKDSLQKIGHFIGGKFVQPSKGDYVQVKNPATGEVIGSVAKGSSEDVERAVKEAEKAKKNWQLMPDTKRADLLQKTGQIIRDNEKKLAVVETKDSGKPIVETIEDIRAIAEQFDYFAGVIRCETGEFSRNANEYIRMISREPLGLVAQIIPWNFPFLLAGWKIAPALAAGNCILIKPSEETPLSLLLFAELVKDVFPPGVLNVINGTGETVGTAMIHHKSIDKIAFTGSTKVGQTIAKAAAKRVIPVSLELGGKSANIIFPDAPMEKAVEGAAMAILYGQGQVCNAGSRLFVHKDIYQEVLKELISLFKKVNIGDPMDEKTRMGTLINERQMNRVLDYIEIGIKEGANLVYGGKRIEEEPFDKGYFIEPTIFADVDNQMRIAQEEIFGPVLVVIPFEEEEELVNMANDSLYGLAGACWTKDISRGLRLARSIDTGLFWINEYHMAPVGTPFGGIKQSGYGRENHKLAIDEYSRLKTVYVSIDTDAYGWYD